MRDDWFAEISFDEPFIATASGKESPRAQNSTRRDSGTGALPAAGNARAGPETRPGDAVRGVVERCQKNLWAGPTSQPGDGGAGVTEGLCRRIGIVQPGDVWARLSIQRGETAA